MAESHLIVADFYFVSYKKYCEFWWNKRACETFSHKISVHVSWKDRVHNCTVSIQRYALQNLMPSTLHVHHDSVHVYVHTGKHYFILFLGV